MLNLIFGLTISMSCHYPILEVMFVRRSVLIEATVIAIVSLVSLSSSVTRLSGTILPWMRSSNQ